MGADAVNVKLTMKVALLYRLMEGWVSVESIAHRLHASVGEIVRVRTWLQGEGYLEGDELRRWVPTREYEDLWAELIPDRPCPLSFCQSRARKAMPANSGQLG